MNRMYIYIGLYRYIVNKSKDDDAWKGEAIS
jgi:hypothetical protein